MTIAKDARPQRSPAARQLEILHAIDLWLEQHPNNRQAINASIFATANAMGCHPHDLAIYLLIRTASL